MDNDEIVKHITDHGVWLIMDDGNTYCIRGEKGVETSLKCLKAVLEIFLEDRTSGESHTETFLPGDDKFKLDPDAKEYAEEMAGAERVVEDPVLDDEFDAGKAYARKKIGELLDEVETAYKELEFDDDEFNPDIKNRQLKQAQINAIKFAKSWVASGGHTDLDGNRACLPW